MPDEKQPDPSSEPSGAGSSPEPEGTPKAEGPKPGTEGAKAAPDADKAEPEKPSPPKPPAKPAEPAAEKKPAAAAHKPAAKKPAVMETQSWEDELTAQMKEHFGDQISEFSVYVGQKFLVAKPEAVTSALEFLKLEADFDYLVDITAADYPKNEERFEVFYILYSFSRNERVRVKTKVKDGQKLESAVSIHPGANWLEREVYDMFGIEFANHPDLKRILLPDEWEGFPLRKDSDILNMDQQWVRTNLEIDSGQ